MEFQKKCFEEHSIIHQLYQIACEGHYYLSPLRLLCFVPDDCSQAEYFNLLERNGMNTDRFYDEEVVALAEFINYTVDPNIPFKIELGRVEEGDIKKSLDPQNCGYELFSYWDELGYTHRSSHQWLLSKIRENGLDENELYTISVDNLNQPTKAFIYKIDDYDNSQLVLTYNI